jgi:hypothetical protein
MNRATAILRPAQPRPAVFRYGQGRCWRCPTTARVAQCRMLDNSATILQDDSGIPLADFEAKRWRLQAFGHYAGPISVFASFYQSQMAKLFQSASPMEFGIGYRWRKNESNLLLAQKESPPGSDEELTPLSQAEGNAAGTAAGAVDTVQHHDLSLLNRRMHQPALK